MKSIIGFIMIIIGSFAALAAVLSITSGLMTIVTLVQATLALTFLFCGFSLAKSKPAITDEIYTPRFEDSDFSKDGVKPLSKEEYEFASFEIWSVLSLPLSKYAVNLREMSGSTVYGYMYGFIDGYLQKHVPCEQQQQFDILNHVVQKYFDFLFENHRNMIPDTSEMEAAFASPNEEFIVGLFVGGRDGIRWAQDPHYSPLGLLDAKIAMQPDINIESVSFAAGKSLRGAINIAKKSAKKGARKVKNKAQEGTKECPYCAERVNLRAKKCKFCYEFI